MPPEVATGEARPEHVTAAHRAFQHELKGKGGSSGSKKLRATPIHNAGLHKLCVTTGYFGLFHICCKRAQHTKARGRLTGCHERS
jgi:hypothetical protein